MNQNKVATTHITPRLRSSLLTLIAALGLAACSNNPQSEESTAATAAPSFEEFLSTVKYDEALGVYVVEGDIALPNMEKLKEYYLQEPNPNALTVDTISGVDNVWSHTAKHALTYCVSQSGFGADYNTVVNAMLAASQAWEGAADVDIQYVPAEDGDCNGDNARVMFSVEYASGQTWNAMSFFPDSSRSSRRLWVDYANATNDPPKTLTGILTHELGHTLGFRHEHVHTGCLNEGGTWRLVTPTYDSASVMHYPPYSWPTCNGTNTGDYALTALDRQGAAALYQVPVRTDFNSDGHGDLLWYNGSTGALAVWFLDNVTHLSPAVPDVAVGPASTSTIPESAGFAMKGIADFNHDGRADLLWYNGTTGQLAVWFMNGTTHLSSSIPDAVIGPASTSTLPASTGWELKGVNDFNRDGNADLLWYNGGTGQLAVWFLEGTTHLGGDAVITPTSTSTIPATAGWEVKSTNDFNHDGNVDILWYNGSTGKLAVWFLNGTTHLPTDAEIGPASTSTIPSSAGWEIRGTDDFDNDGNVDILWYNGSTGATATWYLNGTTHVDGGIVGPASNSTLPASAGWTLLPR